MGFDSVGAGESVVLLMPEERDRPCERTSVFRELRANPSGRQVGGEAAHLATDGPSRFEDLTES